MKLSFITLDVFTTSRYAGNPLAIVQIPAGAVNTLSQAQKQKIATEFNLSESVFVHLPESTTGKDREHVVDIFTVEAELPFAGHPTVGTAFFLLKILGLPTDAIIEKAGRIPVSLDAVTGEAIADIPHEFHVHNITFKSTLSDTPAVCVSIVRGMSFVLVELPDLSSLAQASETLTKSNASAVLDESWQTGFMATMYFVAQGQDTFGRKAYRTRMFTEWMEDPGTGAASCALGCWLTLKESNVQSLRFALTQGVEMGRPNSISLEVTKTAQGSNIKNVALIGAAVKVMEGSLEI